MQNEKIPDLEEMKRKYANISPEDVTSKEGWDKNIETVHSHVVAVHDKRTGIIEENVVEIEGQIGVYFPAEMVYAMNIKLGDRIKMKQLDEHKIMIELRPSK